MTDLISRADAIEAVRKELVCDGRHETHDKTCRFIADVLLSALPSADAEPKMTEEVREALMRLTMCAREECGMCKYKDECGFDFQYKISTDNMNTLLDALSAEAVQADDRIEPNKIYCSPLVAENVEVVVRCKDCKKRGAFGEKGFCVLYAQGVPDEHYCSYGERREP